MKSLVPISLVILLSACAAPQQVADKASAYLNGNCRAMFVDSSMFRYQHLAHAIGGRAVFALSDSPNGQYCGYATNNHKDVKESSFEIQAPWDKLEVVAVARCESVKPASAPPCKVFARNNEIVWTTKTKSSLD